MSVLVAERERLASYAARSAAALTEIVGSVAGVSLVWANDVFAPASDVAIRSARQAFLLSFIGYERKTVDGSASADMKKAAASDPRPVISRNIK
ncbi:hypothetical protein [Burkholderia ubonensis]|uniref:hypothetical protein n=1 Tax=Burkholderia ubonensis TaxID=101571 RepID=UPI001E31B3CF|nr:hypothetical protein [Burkholderia ubonensis]